MENATNQEAPPTQIEEDQMSTENPTDQQIEAELCGVTIRDINQERGHWILNRQAQRYFGMEADEFVRAYRAGELRDHPNQTDVTYVAMLIPLAE